MRDKPDFTALREDPRFSRRLPRVFVGICAFGDIPHDAFESFMIWWGKQVKDLRGVCELSISVSPRKEQYRARNALILMAEKQGADYLLMFDDDQLPHICQNVIGRFLEHPEHLVQGGLYFQRGGNFHPVVMKEQGHGSYRFYMLEELEGAVSTERSTIVPVDVLGHGCQWTDMRVFEKMKQPHHWPYPDAEVVFVPDDRYGLDVNFCRRVKYEQDIQPMLNLGVHVGHLRDSESGVDYRTIDRDEIRGKELWRDYWATVLPRELPNE